MRRSYFPPKIQPAPDEVHVCEAITLVDVTLGYNGQPAVEGVTLTIQCGQQVAVIGPNGAGKSTLFKAIVGLLPLQRGHICIHGEEPQRAGSRLAYIPQREDIDWNFPVTVSDVVVMGRYGRLGWLRWPGRQDWAVVRSVLNQVGMAGLADRQIGELSGGQQQRVFLARALAQDADILLMDEPFTGVDLTTQQTTFEMLERLRLAGKTVLVATHDLNIVAEHFDQVLALNHRLIAYGPTSKVFTRDILKETYGDQLTLIRTVEGTFMAVNEAHFA